jgi:hypothetical protein
MLSRIDNIIYPNRCEVIELTSHQYIYPIYKNGYSSLIYYQRQKNLKILFNQQITKLSNIDIILRDPLDRFVSGVNSFVYDIRLTNPELDYKTILYFVENYLFLNRHYAPQISWLINLSRYLNPTAKLKLHGIDSISQFTPLTVISYKDDKELVLHSEDTERLKSIEHNEVYLKLDSLILELVGQELTFAEILEYIQTKEPIIYKHVLS